MSGDDPSDALLFVEVGGWSLAMVILDAMEKMAGVRLIQAELNDRPGVCLKLTAPLGEIEAAAGEVGPARGSEEHRFGPGRPAGARKMARAGGKRRTCRRRRRDHSGEGDLPLGGGRRRRTASGGQLLDHHRELTRSRRGLASIRPWFRRRR